MRTPTLIQGVADSTLHRDRDQVDRAVTRLVLEFLHARSVTLFHLVQDGPDRRLVRRAESRLDGDFGPVQRDAMARLPTLADQTPYLDCFTNNRVVEGIAPDGNFLAVFPLHGRGEVIGFLSVVSAEVLAVSQMDLVHGVLRIVENHLALLEYGERDTLTGLLNRKTFEGCFEKLRDRPRDSPVAASEPSWLALLDIDRFKSINDRYGHLFGDEVLLLVSHLMKQTFRGADLLFRYGGEEFLILLDQASESGAQIVLERLRSLIANHTFPQVGKVTISIGFTQIDPRDVATTCVERADSALYYCKDHGRNCCHNYERLVAEGHLDAKVEGGTDVELF